MTDVQVDFTQLKIAALALGRAPQELRREIRKAMRRIGVFARAAFRAEFGPRLTDPKTRRRTDPGPRLGTFSGEAKKAIGIRTRETLDGSWKTFVGPRGGAGIQGPGFYTAFHEFGSKATKKVRRTAGAAQDRIQPEIDRALERTVDQILAGW